MAKWKNIITKETLKKLYLKEDLTQQEIADKFKTSQCLILIYLKKYNIPSKPRVGFGVKNPFYGKHHSEETKEKLRIINTGKISPQKGKKAPWCAGNKNPAKRPEVRKLISKRVKETHWDSSGSNNPMWRGGISYEPYSLEFNKKLKELVKKEQEYKCYLCKGFFPVYKHKCIGLQIHHIDYNKLNNKRENLVALCNICHTKTNSNRNFWESILKVKK